MTRASVERLAWLVATAGLLAGLLWLDGARGGPASELSRCNLGLTRSSEPAADVLVVGSSRTGAAIDPVAMADMLAAAGVDGASVDRIALGRNPLRANVGLLDNYLSNRGTPSLIAFEISFLTDRSVGRIDDLGSGDSADAFLYRRDVNLLDYDQIATAPAVARPFTESESALNRARFALEGLITRSGALVYQLASEPGTDFSAEHCEKDDWTRQPEWPADFAFSWDDASAVGPPADRIESLRAAIAAEAPGRELRPWQRQVATGQRYPYDVDAPYRTGEMRLLAEAVEQASDHGVPVVLLPMTLYGTAPDPEDVRALEERFEGQAVVFDIYDAAGVDLSTYWYDDAHLEVGIAGELTTALLAQYILDDGSLAGASSIRSAP